MCRDTSGLRIKNYYEVKMELVLRDINQLQTSYEFWVILEDLKYIQFESFREKWIKINVIQVVSK